MAAIFPLIALQFKQDIFLLGEISTAFFLGVGIFQIPAGIFALRFSPRTAAITGILVSSTAALLFGLALESTHLILLRFIVGAGMAFFFSSSITLIASYYGSRSAGLPIGALNAAHSAGGIIGIFGWIVVAEAIGWRPSVVIGGAIGIVSALSMIIALPREKPVRSIPDPAESASVKEISKRDRAADGSSVQEKTGSSIKSRPLRTILCDSLQVLSNPRLARVGLVLVGIQGAWVLTLTYLVVYVQHLSISPLVAGIVSSLPLISAIISAPLIGRLYDRTANARKLLFICGLGMGVTLVGISSGVLAVIIISVIMAGTFSGGAFTVAYAKARNLQIVPLRKDNVVAPETTGFSSDLYYGALKVAWINGISLVGVLWMPIVFSFVTKQMDYQVAWLLSAAFIIPFVAIPLAKMRD